VVTLSPPDFTKSLSIKLTDLKTDASVLAVAVSVSETLVAILTGIPLDVTCAPFVVTTFDMQAVYQW